jgi:hypothetical protein
VNPDGFDKGEGRRSKTSQKASLLLLTGTMENMYTIEMDIKRMGYEGFYWTDRLSCDSTGRLHNAGGEILGSIKACIFLETK